MRKLSFRKPGRYRVAPKEERTIGGRTFASKLEAEVYADLTFWAQLQGGAVLCQVPFALPGGTKYVADFLVLRPRGLLWEVEVHEAKGHKTEMYRLKKKQVEALYPFKIIEHTKPCRRSSR